MSTVTKKKPSKALIREQSIEKRKEREAAHIQREIEKYDFDKRAIELRRLGKPYAEIAIIMTEERGVPIPVHVVRKHIKNRLANVEGTDELRREELDKLESQAANIREQIMALESTDPMAFDVEMYSKLVDTYLRYRDRIARLMGLDQGGNNGGIGAQKAAQEAAQQVAAAGAGNHLHVHVGSVDAFEEWQRLHQAGVAQLAHDVLELQATEVPDVHVTGMHDHAAGTTLAPHADTTADADRLALPASSLDALALMKEANA